ncbi:hypothetical protein [Nocardia terpenica]|uniref:hypothetical protein n=1 Tax=Nocardia terpenica TaxID=455432 RepID=UPI000AA6E318|nr:hypothetical protein [Nocardia terpenica]NQE90881.1 hypothetical protein [Nocardia terpenica]
MVTARVLGVVRVDACRSQGPEVLVDRIVKWADERDAELVDVWIVESEAEFPQLFASLSPARISVVVVPALWHVYGWMGTIRSDADLWTLQPEICWERKPPPPPPSRQLRQPPGPPWGSDRPTMSGGSPGRGGDRGI